ncbi:MAG: YidB family protein [Variibacter sp.]
MGFLDELFGKKDGQQGGTSPLTLALLALLAYKAYQGHNQGKAAPQGSPAPAPQAPQDQGGLGDILGGLFGGGQQAGTRSPGAQPSGDGGLGDLLRGGLGGLLGGAGAGTVLNGGLGNLLEQLQKAGHGDTADSWIGAGANRQIDPRALEDAVGKDTLETLSRQSGKPYNDVLSELSESLPDAVDKMTPQGRMATRDEAARWS